jgi:pilus assembly protein Flp/PilA
MSAGLRRCERGRPHCGRARVGASQRAFEPEQFNQNYPICRGLNGCASFPGDSEALNPLRSIEMLTTLRSLLDNESGVTAIEYGLIAALIAVAAVAIMKTVGTSLSTTFSTVNSDL